MSSLTRMDSLRERVHQLRRDSALPWWRSSYAVFLLDRAAEYESVGRSPELAATLQRVEHWLNQQESQVQESRAQQLAPRRKEIPLWSSEHLRGLQTRLRQELQARRHLIPGPEREALLLRLERVERYLSTGQLSEARAELNTVRAAWVRRLTRSYRAWSTVPKMNGPMVVQTPAQRSALAPAGPYNSRRNLEDMLSLVGERDPIWVEDFLEVYNDLLQYAERLSDGDKKKKK